MAGRIAQDHSGTQESNARQDTLHDPADGVLVRDQRTVGRSEHDNHGDGCTETHESMGPQTGGLAMQLPIQTKNAADKQSRAEAQGCFFISG
ncbi:MAG: hypothetical protein QOF24_1800 [Verrucomicrobiota bacterium]